MFDLPVFVISCEDDLERRALTDRRLKEQGISYEFFNASNGHVLPISDFEEEQIYIDYPGGRGVALSHKGLWRKMVEEDIPRAVIMEDDVLFHEAFQLLLPFYMSHTPEHAMVYMGYCCMRFNIPSLAVVEGMPLAIHAYILTKDIAQWLLDHFGECHENIDLHMQKLYYSTDPKIRNWKCYVWWNGQFKSKLQYVSKMNVWFEGLIFQDHEMPLAIHRDRNEKL